MISRFEVVLAGFLPCSRGIILNRATRADDVSPTTWQPCFAQLRVLVIIGHHLASCCDQSIQTASVNHETLGSSFGF